MQPSQVKIFDKYMELAIFLTAVITSNMYLDLNISAVHYRKKKQGNFPYTKLTILKKLAEPSFGVGS